jgi:RNA polymerase sigma factor (sigma-70 family)
MPTGSLTEVVHYLRRVAQPRGSNALTDGQLLESYLASRDEIAFEMLVRRHGVMVLGVCRRVLGNVHDAEDAFQATFLVLARKAGSIKPRSQVGNWLHGVALRTALEARTRRARRRSREVQVKDMPQPAIAPDVDFQELHRLLDQELGRLPDKYRSALVLCELEGRSRKEAARQLAIPEGTLSSRLAMGRQMLARRLARHGLAVSVTGLATSLAGQAQAALPAALLRATTRAALLTGAGQSAGGLVSSHVVTLTQGVLKTMFLHKLKVLTVLLLGIAVGGLGAGVLTLPGKSDAIARAAQRADAPRSGTAAPRAEPEEPLDAGLLLDPGIQKELRLSQNQVQRLKAAAVEAEHKHDGSRKEIQQLQKQIEQLQNQIRSLQRKINTDRDQAVVKAAPDIISARAIQRLRQIQRQRRGAEALLKDPRVQRLLKLDDEQMMRIEKALKEAQPWGAVYALQDLVVQMPYRQAVTLYSLERFQNPKVLAQVGALLTPEQRRVLRSYLGQPVQGGSLDWLSPKAGK